MRWSRPIFSSRNTLSFGLDISSAAVTLLELSYAQDHYKVESYGQYALSADIVNGNMILDVEALANAIRDLLADLQLWSCFEGQLEAVIAVPDACAISKTISVNERLTEKDLEGLVQMELETLIQGSMDDLCFDFKRVESTSPQTDLKDLVIVATRIHHIQDRMAALRRLGITVKVVDLESCALQRVLPLILPQEKRLGLSVLLDLGSSFLKIFFFKQGSLVFMREEEFGSTVQAMDDEDYREALLIRLKRARHFFHAAFPQHDVISDILLGGCGANQAELAGWIQQKCAIFTSIANPFLTMTMASGLDAARLHGDAPMYLTACGLAKRAC
ncbi:MAG: pilus assembly protein PilM [Gammaproteobacteria bacterium]|nr:pilus assembly protein PilM [Gammaproteobacteria bacterium]